MKKGLLLGVAALSLGLVSLASSADAHGRRHHHRGGIHVGVDVGVAHHYRAPVYGYGYWNDGYGYDNYGYDAYNYNNSYYPDYADGYGYGGYYRAPRAYVDTYYVRTPRIVVRHHRSWQGHRRHRR